MLKLKHLASAFFMLIMYQTVYSQFGFSHEIGVVAGPVEFRSDFGSRNDTKTNFGNSGFGIGIVHYINFAYRSDCNCYTTDTYFNDHFKIRNELSYNKTNLDHLGEWVDPSKNSSDSNRLRGHKGVAQNLDIGTQIEFFPKSIRSFQAFSYKFAPYGSLGVHYTSFTPKVTTTYANPDPDEFGNVLNPSNFYLAWEPGSVDASSGSTWSLVSSVGVRYKLGKLSDLLLDVRWQYYFSDWVDGLNHQLPYNQNNDWLLWLNIGYIYYLN